MVKEIKQLLDIKNLLNIKSMSGELQSVQSIKEVQLFFQRDDEIHPIISGNKIRKLIRPLVKIVDSNVSGVLSMGGNHSNYCHALAYACQQLKLNCFLLIRGPEPKSWGATLQDIKQYNASIEFVDRAFFRELRDSKTLGETLASEKDLTWLPEGGVTTLGLQTMMEAATELPHDIEHIYVPVGTGMTALGIALGIEKMGRSTQVKGVVVLKGAQYLENELKQFSEHSGYSWPKNFTLTHEYCGKGFAKIDDALWQRMLQYEEQLNITLDPVYTVKMCDAFMDSLNKKVFHKHNKVLLWHTGGLQGRRRLSND